MTPTSEIQEGQSFGRLFSHEVAVMSVTGEGNSGLSSSPSQILEKKLQILSGGLELVDAWLPSVAATSMENRDTSFPKPRNSTPSSQLGCHNGFTTPRWRGQSPFPLRKIFKDIYSRGHLYP